MKSSASRFWLSFDFPAMRSMAISNPTINASWLSMKSSGASAIF
ncbi:MAG: hypothetical protein VX073_02325 [Pseudomonadota bacterium]|nr:hypothetical protein [Pseudomonadota bacterium]